MSATDLAGLINTAKLSTASAAGQAMLLKASQANPNELKVLWDLAREFRDYARKNPPEADYVLYADYVFNPQNWEQGYVHFVVCDRKGEWVIVDMQNSHQPDYESIKPTSRADCDKLLVKRLAELPSGGSGRNGDRGG
jgi:predicted nicotinamide N-methyase